MELFAWSGTKRTPRWRTPAVAALAHRYPTLSTLDLLNKAKTAAARMNITELDTKPTNRELFEWLAKLGRVAAI